MKINKPADGFHIRYMPEARAMLEAIRRKDELHARRIEAVVDRISKTGDIEGDSLSDEHPFENRVMSDIDREHVVSVLYGLLGDTATIKSMTTMNYPSA